MRTLTREIRRQARAEPAAAAAAAMAALAGLGRAEAAEDEGLRAGLRGEAQELVRLAVRGGARAEALEGLWAAYAADPGGALDPVGDAWGELCASAGAAAAWAERLGAEVREIWGAGGDARASRAALGALLAAGRPREVLALLELRPVGLWPERRFGVLALAALGEVDAALAYAQASNPLGHPYEQAIAQTCEAVLLAAGRRDEAYREHAFAANVRQNCLQTFRALAARYPEIAPAELLAELIAASPGCEGRWFATARSLRLYEVALEIARRSPCDPRTLNRAAAERLAEDPRFALEVALASLRWIAADAGYAIDGADVYEAYDRVMEAAARLGVEAAARAEVRAIGEAVGPSAGWVAHLLAGELGGVDAG